MSRKWSAETQFHEVTLRRKDMVCQACGRRLHHQVTRRRCVYRFVGPTRLACQLVSCTNSACCEYHHLFSPEEESLIALPQWRIDWEILLWIGYRRFKRHWSIPQIQAELLDTYQIALSVALLAAPVAQAPLQ